MSGLLQIVFYGATTGEYDLETSKKRFQKLFNLPETRTEKLFGGQEFVIKSGISKEQAMNFAIKISEAGCECAIEDMPDENDPTNDPNFVEQRKGDRRVRTRRPPRPGAIVPDRRLMAGRRKGDADSSGQKVG
ncbi:MAG: hypothetical protein ACI9FB_001844 [Candidatus Azotimanducaceae bacterium]|jgi:hypothetical protein